MQALRDGYRALVVGASGGIGSAVEALLRDDPRAGAVSGLGRRSDPGLDLTDEPSIAAAAQALSIADGIDLVFDATGALSIDGVGPEKTLRALDHAAMARQFAVNAIGPALLIKHFLPLMPRDRRAVFVTLSARVGSIGDNSLGGWISYRASKAALNQIVRTAAIEAARTHPQAVIAALHPGTVATRLSAAFSRGHTVFDPEDAAERLLAVVDGLEPPASGGFFAYDGSVVPG